MHFKEAYLVLRAMLPAGTDVSARRLVMEPIAAGYKAGSNL